MDVTRLLLAAGGIWGALGVMLLAAGAHASSGLATTAGQMLLFHAPVLLTGALALRSGAVLPVVGFAALLLIVVGTAVFAGDIALRAFKDVRLFPMAAPVGGAMTIAGWLLLAVAALLAPRRPR